MRNKIIFTAIWTIFAFLLIIALPQISVSEAANEKKIELTFSTMFPRKHLHTVLNEEFCDEIRKRTKGRVEITVYPGGTLTSAAKCYEGVVKGISDMGMSSPAYVQGRFPASEVLLQPMETSTGWVTTKVYNDFYKKFRLAEYDDVHVLYLHGPGPNLIATRSIPVRKLGDLRGLLIRAVGPTAETIKAWGATPRAMPMGEAYESLSKGIVEGGFIAAAALRGFKLAEVVKYLTVPPVSNVGGIFVVMNKKKWNAMPEDIKEIFNQVSQEWVEKHGMVWRYYTEAGLDYFRGLGKGREIISIPKDQEREWRKAIEPVLEKYVEDTMRKGLPAKEYIDYVKTRTRYWAEKQPSGEVCTNWVKENVLRK